MQRAVKKKMFRCPKCVFLQQTDLLNPVTAGYDAVDSNLLAALKYLLNLQPAAVEASAEASNAAGSSTSSDSAEVVEAAVVSASRVDPGAADLTQDQLTAPDPAGLDKESGEEPEEDGDELKQVCGLRLNPNYAVVLDALTCLVSDSQPRRLFLHHVLSVYEFHSSHVILIQMCSCSLTLPPPVSLPTVYFHPNKMSFDRPCLSCSYRCCGVTRSSFRRQRCLIPPFLRLSTHLKPILLMAVTGCRVLFVLLSFQPETLQTSLQSHDVLKNILV